PVTTSLHPPLRSPDVPPPLTATDPLPLPDALPIFNVNVDEPPAVTVVGLNDPVTPAGAPLNDNATDCAAPLVTAVLIVDVVEPQFTAPNDCTPAPSETPFAAVALRLTPVVWVAEVP